MTDKTEQGNPDVVPAEKVWIWFAVPDVGREHLIMVLVGDAEKGFTYRPLMALDEDTAKGFEEHARGAARDLNVEAILREFECTRITRAAL